ncbi:MAG: immunoglobulin-like domain-containing protein [Oscillospiraceae bacterium]
MKRIISILCAGAILLGSAACKSSGVADNSVPEPDSVGAAAQGTTSGETSSEGGSDIAAAKPDSEKSSIAADIGATEGANGMGALEENHIPLEEKDVVAELSGEEFEIGTESVQLTLTYVGENGGYDYTLGSEYSLERWGDNGDWQSVPFAENVGFNAMGYLFGGRNTTASFTVSLADYMYAEPLSAGTYRVIKPLCGEVSISAVFELKDTDIDGLAVAEEKGVFSLNIIEIGDGYMLCRPVFTSPVKYEVICSEELCREFAAGDRISVEYAPMYMIDDMNYRVIAQNITREKSDDRLDDGLRGEPDF